tara:strand:- start:850 stop:1053 length:204 start_codon:yes stop_codon:yes gene_type:complete
MKNLKNSNDHYEEPLTSKKEVSPRSIKFLGSSLRPTPFPKSACVKPQRSIKGMKSVRPRSKSFAKEE